MTSTLPIMTRRPWLSCKDYQTLCMLNRKYDLGLTPETFLQQRRKWARLRSHPLPFLQEIDVPAFSEESMLRARMLMLEELAEDDAATGESEAESERGSVHGERVCH